MSLFGSNTFIHLHNGNNEQVQPQLYSVCTKNGLWNNDPSLWHRAIVNLKGIHTISVFTRLENLRYDSSSTLLVFFVFFVWPDPVVCMWIRSNANWVSLVGDLNLLCGVFLFFFLTKCVVYFCCFRLNSHLTFVW